MRFFPNGISKLWLNFADSKGARDATVVPLPALLAGSPDVSEKYTVYAHTFTNLLELRHLRNTKEPSYVGITKNGWAHRWSQHLSSAASGSPYRFHEAIRRFYPKNFALHEIIACGATYEEAMRIEEWAVDSFSLYPRGFNMIPGGYAGMKVLWTRGGPENNRLGEARKRNS
jgi:hypothetical protein